MDLVSIVPQVNSLVLLTSLSESGDDLIEELLRSKRSKNTRRAYSKDLKLFFQFVAHSDPTPGLIAEFLSCDRHDALRLVLHWKAHQISEGLTEATINRRLSAVKALVSHAQTTGRCDWSLADAKGERIKSYRDTSGVDLATIRKLLKVPDRATLKGKRDYAILRLLWDNALRRDEVCKLNLENFEPERERLSVLGKGRGAQAEYVDLTDNSIAAIQAWLAARGEAEEKQPLFLRLDRWGGQGGRITGDGLAYLVDSIAKQAGLTKKMSPHRWRHSAITASLDAGNDVDEVQKLSRHANLNTLMLYNDNRKKAQKKVSRSLADLVDD